MSCRRAEDALEALLSSCRPCLSKSCLARRPRGARLLSSATSAYPQRPRRRPARRDRHPPRSAVCDARRAVYTEAGGQLRKVGFVQDRRLNSTQEPAKNLPVAPRVAILGGGITGLTAAYYLAQDLPPRSKIVLYEGDSRVGGWVRSERVPVDVSGVKSEVLFERGPRMMSTRGMADNNDRLVMFDLVSCLPPSPALPALTCANPPACLIDHQHRPSLHRWQRGHPAVHMS